MNKELQKNTLIPSYRQEFYRSDNTLVLIGIPAITGICYSYPDSNNKQSILSSPL